MKSLLYCYWQLLEYNASLIFNNTGGEKANQSVLLIQHYNIMFSTVNDSFSKLVESLSIDKIHLHC